MLDNSSERRSDWFKFWNWVFQEFHQVIQWDTETLSTVIQGTRGALKGANRDAGVTGQTEEFREMKLERSTQHALKALLRLYSIGGRVIENI